MEVNSFLSKLSWIGHFLRTPAFAVFGSDKRVRFGDRLVEIEIGKLFFGRPGFAYSAQNTDVRSVACVGALAQSPCTPVLATLVAAS